MRDIYTQRSPAVILGSNGKYEQLIPAVPPFLKGNQPIYARVDGCGSVELYQREDPVTKPKEQTMALKPFGIIFPPYISHN
ncbi:MAG: hypothetical protein UV61_C0033G0006 [Candidatus Gottesmanbacteria bacterium GW2011_GWB1_43_11]|uniref:Uncharacterized protein n=1 Tax=Candidatus Gottesmanbacteria bacterium GW2011_GWB1_43_11 TaxID=1618446 RepID=A0A0G1CEU0_9BACT|nr:MAG: hypothetical protein UV04_C0038G0007 [Candidatus Gottesmanbacteria bacterium GW2011_GWA2_42_16]KKS50989.1 MAG: hypothetical protein UV17_C0066G0006 [Candidatus Gottesmanbacteria bacterium GW2011_GWA1_42_26]KKS80307.1 MAG: hypothetical protein UV55_C0043G0017 [Candidatus Gottesmanbacteria bacterium GW2011_GWC1_43_10]KKS84280.1 MAG: hypothetical protein UV61_C0033G0006 [Candidatus Gottesmanbacteria bacterium GW2011_GWB1_43_11]HCM38043.1 hypothetical protein [Patescibacteria group bacteriu